LTPICIRSPVCWGFGAPDPTGGAYSAPPDPLTVFRGPTSNGRGEESREGEGEGERRGKGDEAREEKRRRRKGRAGKRGSSSFALERK